jgi:hypothetical protein
MKHWLQNFFFVSVLGIACVQVEAARAQYTLSHRPQTYQELTSGMNIPMRWADTVNPYTYVDLNGLTFKLFGEEFALNEFYPIAISKWGNVEIRSAKSAVIIDPFHTSSLDSLKPGAAVSLDVEGATGDRILKIQWKDMGFTGFPIEETVNFQLWMYERTGQVEFYYGPHSLVCDKNDPTLQGAYVGMFIAVPDFSKINKIFWIYGDPENPKTSKTNIKAMHCHFDVNTAVALNAPSADVAMHEEETVIPGLLVQRGSTIKLDNASSLKLYSITGQLVMDAESASASLALDVIASGRYFLEYVQNGEVCRRPVVIQ